MSKRKVYRFGFGTKERPGSAVWRITTVPKEGSVYMNNTPEFGDKIHVSLHASGNFHLKLKEQRYNLEPPFIQPNSHFIHGPCIFFDRQDRNLPPPPATGKINKVNWLGWPKSGNLFVISTYYCDPGISVKCEQHERMICGPLKARLLHKDKNFYVIITERKMNPEEVESSQDPHKNLEFEGGFPEFLELVRVSKTERGLSAIIISGFNATRR